MTHLYHSPIGIAVVHNSVVLREWYAKLPS
jgi:hypothetical protein